MGAITDLLSAELAISALSAYLLLRILPQLPRLIAGNKTLETERHNEATTTDAQGELNENRLIFNTYKAKYMELETKLAEKLLSNEKLKNRLESLEEGVETTEYMIQTLDTVIDHVDPQASATVSYDGIASIKIQMPEHTESASSAVSNSGHMAETAARRHLGLPPTTADILLTPEPTPPSHGPQTRPQSGPKGEKEHGRAR